MDANEVEWQVIGGITLSDDVIRLIADLLIEAAEREALEATAA